MTKQEIYTPPLSDLGNVQKKREHENTITKKISPTNVHETAKSSVEHCGGKFHRSCRLPENAKTYEVMASMENRVVVVTVPKEEVNKPEKKVTENEDIKGFRFIST
ncbi:hypothetical protein REPUB_Repub01dG0114500 [Reevesia pubescens]